MRAFLEKYRRLLIVISFPYVYLLMILILPTGFAGTAPGGLTSVGEAITIDGYEQSENIHTVYVLSYNPLTPFQSWLLSADDKMSVRPMNVFEQDLSWREQYAQGQLTKRVSYTNALINAYLLAAESSDAIDMTYHYAGLSVYYAPSRLSELKIGDSIIAIDGMSHETYTHDDFLQLIDLSDVTFTVQRNDEEPFTVSYAFLEGDLPFLFYPNYTIDEAVPNYRLPGEDSVYGGPSGGLMQTISIYVSLLNINIFEDVLAGTGTIEPDGSIGRIGGLKQKIYTAMDADVDLFFIPEAHRAEFQSYGFEDLPFETVFIAHRDDIKEVMGERYETSS
jgi:Lon-like protease